MFLFKLQDLCLVHLHLFIIRSNNQYMVQFEEKILRSFSYCCNNSDSLAVVTCNRQCGVCAFVRLTEIFALMNTSVLKSWYWRVSRFVNERSTRTELQLINPGQKVDFYVRTDVFMKCPKAKKNME